MAKFNTGTVRAAVKSPVQTERTPSGVTFEGGPGYARSAQSELFLLAVSNMVGEDTFYEKAGDRDDRYRTLVRQVAAAEPEWMVGFLGWLRNEANMRTASVVGAAEAAHALIEAKIPGARKVVATALQRADEPGELIAYWLAAYGKTIPIGVKRGLADAVVRLYSERSLLKYDSRERAVRFGDVIELVQPATHRREIRGTVQSDLFRHAIDRRHGRDDVPDSLAMVRANADLRAELALGPMTITPELLQNTGTTWEDILSLLGSKVDKAKLWTALIPSMGYMALLRNLRNFDQAGVSDEVAETVAKRLADPEQVAKSRQLPMRFLSAYRAAPSLRWSYPLEKALGHCLANIPALPGRTLILVDTSSSMNAGFSKDGTLMRWDAAVIFGVALGQRCADGEVVSFSSTAQYFGQAHGPHTKAFGLRAGESLLKSLERWKGEGYFLGGGTATAGALRRHFNGHDRVVIVTDEQAASDGPVDKQVPNQVPLYTWNLAGYERGHAPSGLGTRHTFGGLTDAAFRMIPLLEAGANAAWPWVARA